MYIKHKNDYEQRISNWKRSFGQKTGWAKYKFQRKYGIRRYHRRRRLRIV